MRCSRPRPLPTQLFIVHCRPHIIILLYLSLSNFLLVSVSLNVPLADLQVRNLEAHAWTHAVCDCPSAIVVLRTFCIGARYGLSVTCVTARCATSRCCTSNAWLLQSRRQAAKPCSSRGTHCACATLRLSLQDVDRICCGQEPCCWRACNVLRGRLLLSYISLNILIEKMFQLSVVRINGVCFLSVANHLPTRVVVKCRPTAFSVHSNGSPFAVVGDVTPTDVQVTGN